jgi:hypothetical protein
MREACAKTPGFAISESPAYVARGVVALARAGDADRWAGTIISSGQLADAHVVIRADFDYRASVLRQFPETFSVPTLSHPAG